MQETKGSMETAYCDYVYDNSYSPVIFDTCTFLSTPTDCNVGNQALYGFGKFD